MDHVRGGIPAALAELPPTRPSPEQGARDKIALDEIAQTLNKDGWSPNTTQRIAEIVARTGRALFDPMLVGTVITAEVLEQDNGRLLAHVDAGVLVVFVHQDDDAGLVIDAHLRADQARDRLQITLDGAPLTLPHPPTEGSV